MSSTSSERFTATDGSLVALVDCDTFYASCERVCRPDLAGRPIVVLSNNDGCVVARSREAKKAGIPMGEPEFKIRPLLQKHNVAVFSSNYTLYGDISRRVMETIASIAPQMEIYSIDEAFVMMAGAIAKNATEAAREIRSRVLRWVGVPVSIGIAPTRVLAKIATRVAKKYPAYGGIFDLSQCGKIDDLLKSVPVGDIWGVGRHGAAKLRAAGITTALALRDASPGLARKLLTVAGLNILMELRGIPSIREEIPVTHSCIISSRSLGYKVRALEPLEEAMAFHASRAAEKLRQKHLLAGMVGARVQTAWHAEDRPQHDEMAMVRLPRPTCDTAAIIRAAQTALRRVFRYGYEYAKAMVMLVDLFDPAKGQGSLLGQDAASIIHESKRLKLMDLLDRINRIEGRGTVAFAAQGPKDAAWHMKRERLSPRWTTDLADLVRVGGVPGVFDAGEIAR